MFKNAKKKKSLSKNTILNSKFLLEHKICGIISKIHSSKTLQALESLSVKKEEPDVLALVS